MLSKEERETIITTSDALDYWCVYTSVPSMMGRLSKVYMPVKEYKDQKGSVVALDFQVPKGVVSIKMPRDTSKPKKPRSEKQIQALADARAKRFGKMD